MEAQPTSPAERIGMLDTTRGIAVLGILLMNIVGFGLPQAYDDPTNWGGYAGANLAVWRAMSLFFEGTMRGLFTLLFGASALLFLQRHAARSSGLWPADLYFRRTMWLIAFGVVNGYLLLWNGDILFHYGVVGLLLFVFRSLAARPLIVCAAVIMLLQTTVTVFEWRDFRDLQRQAQAAQTAQLSGEPLSFDEQESIDLYAATLDEFKPPRAELERRVSEMRRGFLGALSIVAPQTWQMHTGFFFRHGLLESLGMMLLGMALLKVGVLTGASPPRVYAAMALLGYAIGLTVNLYETNLLESDMFSVDALLQSYLTYDLGRIPMTLGHIGMIGLLYRVLSLQATMRVLGSVGQMALTNYLMQSVIGMLLFTGVGLAWFGQLQRFELYYVLAAVWAVQLVLSPLWLRHLRFGPAEWLWRSLTYWRIQPLRRAVPEPATTIPA